MKQAFGDDALGQSEAHDWFKHFKDLRTSVDDNLHSEQPSTGIRPENVTDVRIAIVVDCKWTIHDICNIMGLSFGMCQSILSDELNMRHL